MIHSDSLTRRRPQQPTKCDDLIINTLINAKASGKSENTLTSISYTLKRMNRNVNLTNPEEVKTYIANLEVTNATKAKLCFVYNWFCQTNNIKWKKPRYRWERKIPLIPSTANIDRIISSSSKKYATIFTILKETGLEGHELATTDRQHIDSDRGIINVQGCKGHNSRSIKLKEKTADMLRAYLARYTSNKPFPNSRSMGEACRKFRNRLSDTLKDPQLRTIPLRNLRHYYATMLYDKTKDILLVKQRLGHKKIETTMFYTQLIAFAENEEYTCKTAKDVQQASELIEAGFQYVTEVDGLKLFRKRK